MSGPTERSETPSIGRRTLTNAPLPAVVEDLDEEELALWEILSDESGIDLCEFVWYDPSMKATDFCFRAWDFQWAWWRTKATYYLDHAARALGKSYSIMCRSFVFIFMFPNDEMLIAAPTLNHLEFITEKIERRIRNTRLSREMMSGKQGSVTHRPFLMTFVNGSKIMGRIPGADGMNFKGAHPVWLELDEAQDMPETGWNELAETLERGKEGARYAAHGVTRGPGGKFHEYAHNVNTVWTVHSPVAMNRPNWTAEEREDKIRLYGSVEDPNYRRNIYGKPGDTLSPLFVVSSLMRSVEDDIEHEYNILEYQYIRLTKEMIEEADGNVEILLNLSTEHLANYKTFWIGADIGFVADPTEILTFAEYHPGKTELAYLKRRKKAIPLDGTSKFKLVSRIKLERVNAPLQRKIVQVVFDHYMPQQFTMDSTGNGLPLLQEIQENIPDYVKYIKGFKANEKILVDWEQGKEGEEAEIWREVKEYGLDTLRELVDHQRLWLPWDMQILNDYQGQDYTIKAGTGMNRYGKRQYSRGSFHTLDASYNALLGWKQRPIEEVTKKSKTGSVIDVAIY